MKRTATFPTSRGPALLGTMAKHFGHKVPVTTEGGQATIAFEAGTAHLSETPDGLSLTVTAPEADQAGLCDVVERHLMRFAHREDPAPLAWSEAAG